WLTGRVDVDGASNQALLRDIVVTDVHWPEGTPEHQDKVAKFIASLAPTVGIPFSLDRLKASLATANLQQQRTAESFKHDAPRIVVMDRLAELLQYDGEPRAMAIPDSDLEQVVNSAFAVLHDVKHKRYYLSGGKVWYVAEDAKGPWKPTDDVPKDVRKRVPPDTSTAPAPAKPPIVVVATEPTELIATDGPAAWQPLVKGDLMYVTNTETPVVREVATGSVFVLLSGRWYRAATLDGPWTVVRPDQLPATFQDIPASSPLGAVRVSIAGTREAQDAMLDAQVPQTAAISRSQAKLEVQYDGEPKFKAVEGTKVEYAVNTSSQVLRIEGRYYACDQAVWFVAAKATGPWAVADSVPTHEIQRIPPSEPVYNVTHVTIYETTPTVVYVGYTPGYMWSYPWYGAPIYGTGYYYPPYWGGVYYPRPYTYGYHVAYNPYTGWSMGFSYSNGFMSVGVGFGGGYGGYYRPGYPPGYYRGPAYYPPGGYRRPYYPPNHRPGYPRPSPFADGGRRPDGWGDRGRDGRGSHDNLYQRGDNAGRMAPSAERRDAALQSMDRVGKGPNDVFAGSDGKVYRKSQDGWQNRDEGQWKSAAGAGADRR
ncbi:MAG: carbohydrate-binding family V/XII, partial [bacterium]